MGISHGKTGLGCVWVSTASSHPLKGTECSFRWEQNQNKQWKLLFIRWEHQPSGRSHSLQRPGGGDPRDAFSCGVWRPLLALAEKLLPLLRNACRICSLSPSLHLGNSILSWEGSLTRPSWEGDRDFFSQPSSSYAVKQIDSQRDPTLNLRAGSLQAVFCFCCRAHVKFWANI